MSFMVDDMQRYAALIPHIDYVSAQRLFTADAHHGPRSRSRAKMDDAADCWSDHVSFYPPIQPPAAKHMTAKTKLVAQNIAAAGRSFPSQAIMPTNNIRPTMKTTQTQNKIILSTHPAAATANSLALLRNIRFLVSYSHQAERIRGMA